MIYADSQIPADTLMILAGAPSRAASDGENHGPFTEALLEVLPKPSENLMSTLFAVSDHVSKGTGGNQVPWLKFDGSGQIFREQSFLNRGVPVAVKAEDSVTSTEMAKLKEELAAALAKIAAADGNAAEMAKLQKELEEARTKMAAATHGPRGRACGAGSIRCRPGNTAP